MRTIVESPQARMRRELGLPEKVGRSRFRVDDYFPFSCGEHVCRHDDERHVGRVIAVISNAVRVRWENGWKEDCEMRDLRRAS